MGILPAFAHPWWLLALLLVPLLVWWWLWQGRAAVRYSSAALVPLPGRRGDWSRRLGAGLRGAALTFVVLALAGPRWPDPGTRLPAYGLSIVMVVDVSRSMDDRDFVWQGQPISRLDAVKRVFGLFVVGGEGPDEPPGSTRRFEGRPSDLIGLVAFATRPETACPLTLDHAALVKILDAEQPRLLPGEGTTNLGDAIAWGLHRLRQAPTRRKVLVLLTDGEHNVGEPALKPRQAAQLAANLGVPIYAIHAGGTTSSSETDDPTSAAEAIKAKETLKTIAAMTGGRYFAAEDTAALLDVCQQIDGLERQEIPSLHYRRYYEGFVWFGLAALVLCVSVTVLDNTIWRKLP